MATAKQRFRNEHLSPIVEMLEKLDLTCTVVRSQWGVVGSTYANDTTPYDDGRPTENLDQFTEGNVNAIMTGIANLQDNIIAPNRALLRKVAVRNPEIS